MDATVNEKPDSGIVKDDDEVEELSCTALRTDGLTAPKRRPVRKRRNLWSQTNKRRKCSLVKKVKPKVFDEYWEIESVLAVRERVVKPPKDAVKNAIPTSRNSADKSHSAPTTVTEFLIQWKGSFENSWEPEENLCDSALDDAHLLLEKEATRKLGLLDQKKASNGHVVRRSSPRLKSTNSEILDEDSDDDLISENVDGASDSEGIDSEGPHDSFPDQCQEEGVDTLKVNTAVDSNDLIIEDTNFDWSNSSLKKMPIQRISIHDPNCKTQLMMARMLGVPIVLTHHKGWVQFASRWLSLPTAHALSVSPISSSGLDAAISPNTKTSHCRSMYSMCQSMNCFSSHLNVSKMKKSLPKVEILI
jgi:hypothetical protein